ncbi:MAG TPA: diacylglycerol kinase family protein [Nitrososphaeraceae archaeon]
MSLRLKVPQTISNNKKQNQVVVTKFDELILILNPNSQGGATGKNWDNTYAAIKEYLPKQHRIIFTKRANAGTNITRKLLKAGYNNIAAVGGDGTINEVANGFFNIRAKNRSALDPMKFKPEPRLISINPKATCWIIPSGSRNVLAASLGIPHQGIESFKSINQMKNRKMDVIGVTISDKASPTTTLSRIVLNAAEMGAGAEIIERSKRVRGKIKSRLLSTVAGIVSTLPTYESNECDIIIDGKKITSMVTMVVVANGNFLGGGFNVAPKANISDGKLDVVIMKNSGSFRMLKKLVEMKGDSHYTFEEDILYYQASQVAFLPKNRNMTVSLDGEPVGFLPAIFKVYHNALNVKSELDMA